MAGITAFPIGIPQLLLISFDGFGWDYLGRISETKVPNFHAFMDSGVHVRWIENVFPTVTRVNHMSLVSGLFAESHGIVHNNFFDPDLQKYIPAAGRLTTDDSKWVDVGAEPIWVTNSKAREGRRSGCILWPCGDAKIKGYLPDEVIPGEWSVTEDEYPPEQRIDKAISWLTNSENPANFVAVYFNEPDDFAHKFGPNSQEVLNSIVQRDKIVGYLMKKMDEKQLSGRLNVILTSDHGQAAVLSQTEINIDQLVDPAWYTPVPDLSDSQTVINIWPKEGRLQDLVKGLQHHHLQVAVKSESSDLRVLHYAASNRIAPIVLYADPGWVIINNKTSHWSHKGQHGWDPRYSSEMYPFFLASGPAFKKGVKDAAPFHIVDVYSLMCHVLQVQPAPNNGSLLNALHILQESPPSKERENSYNRCRTSERCCLNAIIVSLLKNYFFHYIACTHMSL